MILHETWTKSINELIPNISGETNNFQTYEVLELLNLKPYQLRFWESEFDVIQSQKLPHGNVYSSKDLRILLRLKFLLLDQQFSVEKVKALIDLELRAVNLVETPTEVVAAPEINNSESMDMNVFITPSSLFEEMSRETFQVSETAVEFKQNKMEIDGEAILNAIHDCRRRLEETFRLNT